MNRMVVLMYHALYADERELAALDPADRPYAVAAREFERQLDGLAANGLAVTDPARLPGPLPDGRTVVLTFDDGHASNHRHASAILARRGLRAAFFITTDFIGNRAGFCTWAQLRDLAAFGNVIGAHGRSHRFLDDLPSAEAQAEMRDARDTLEQGLGAAVTQWSFPGGRFGPREIAFGHGLGYRVFHTSRIGAVRGPQVATGAVLPRIAVRAGMSAEQVAALASAAPVPLARARALGAAKTFARRLAGNRLYHALYERRSV